MNSEVDGINRFPRQSESEDFDPIASLLAALEELERIKNNYEKLEKNYGDLKSKLDELKEDNSRAHSYFNKSIINLQPEQSELWEDRLEVLVDLLRCNKGMMRKSRAQELMKLSRFQMRNLLNFGAHRIGTRPDPDNGREMLLILKRRSDVI